MGRTVYPRPGGGGPVGGIRVYPVRPGAVETKMLRRWFPDLPAEQVMTPAAVAETIWRLADPAWAPASGGAFPVRL